MGDTALFALGKGAQCCGNQEPRGIACAPPTLDPKRVRAVHCAWHEPACLTSTGIPSGTGEGVDRRVYRLPIAQDCPPSDCKPQLHRGLRPPAPPCRSRSLPVPVAGEDAGHSARLGAPVLGHPDCQCSVALFTDAAHGPSGLCPHLKNTTARVKRHSLMLCPVPHHCSTPSLLISMPCHSPPPLTTAQTPFRLYSVSSYSLRSRNPPPFQKSACCPSTLPLGSSSP